jgi:transcriptional regulator with XRE-family HTH domain
MTSTLHDEEYRAFIIRLIALRKATGVTQAQLAARIGKPQSYVSKSERFERRVDPAEFRLIVLALGHDPAAVFAEISEHLRSSS